MHRYRQMGAAACAGSPRVLPAWTRSTNYGHWRDGRRCLMAGADARRWTWYGQGHRDSGGGKTACQRMTVIDGQVMIVDRPEPGDPTACRECWQPSPGTTDIHWHQP